MRAIAFKFSRETGREDREARLTEIRGWKGVRAAGPLKPDAADPELQTMHYAYVGEEAEIEELVRRLARLPGVESASLPAVRKLVP